MLRPAERLRERTDLNNRGMRLLHLAGTFTPIDPVGLPARLEAADFMILLLT